LKRLPFKSLRRLNLLTFVSLQPHPNYRWQFSWDCTQWGLFLFPIFPLLGVVGLALTLFSVWKQQFRTIIQRPINQGFAILSLWLIFTSCFAFQPAEAFLGLANFLPFFAAFAAFHVLIQTPAQLRQLAWLLVLPAAVVLLLGFGQLFWGWSGLVQLQGLFGWVIEPQGNPVGRMASVFMYANILAAYLLIIFILALGLWLETYQILRTSFWVPVIYWVRIGFLSVVVSSSAIALILTDSRNAWIITLLSCFAFALYQGWRWLVAIVTSIAGAIFWSAFGPSPVREWLRTIVPAFFWARLTDQLYPDRPVALMRTTQWHFAELMTQQRPWLGWGLRNFTPLYKEQTQVWLGHPHNLFLMLTAETGIPATLLFCGLVTWGIVQAIQTLRGRFYPRWQDRLILFTYLVAFGSCILFNLADVTIFDARVNTLGWLLFSAICGVAFKSKSSYLSF
jgi:O-antigen ligase